MVPVCSPPPQAELGWRNGPAGPAGPVGPVGPAGPKGDIGYPSDEQVKEQIGVYIYENPDVVIDEYLIKEETNNWLDRESREWAYILISSDEDFLLPVNILNDNMISPETVYSSMFTETRLAQVEEGVQGWTDDRINTFIDNWFEPDIKTISSRVKRTRTGWTIIVDIDYPSVTFPNSGVVSIDNTDFPPRHNINVPVFGVDSSQNPCFMYFKINTNGEMTLELQSLTPSNSMAYNIAGQAVYTMGVL